MNVLDAMQRLQAADPFVMNERAGTAFCFACGSYDKHASDCPVLAMPQIVKALEGIVSDDLTVAELCDTHAKMCGGTWPGCSMQPRTAETTS